MAEAALSLETGRERQMESIAGRVALVGERPEEEESGL
jgi:hypothetical protein